MERNLQNVRPNFNSTRTGRANPAMLDRIEMTTNVDNSDSKLWPDSITKAFIDIMVDEVTKGNMSSGAFHTRIWNSMTTRLNSITNRSYKKEQLKAKMHRLRAMYREFYLLLQNTGFGWDADTNTVTASEEVWQSYLRVHDKAAQFQKKGYDHYKLLGIIFNKNNATGVLYHSSNQDPPNIEEENELETQYLNTGSNIHVDNDSSDDDIQEGERNTHSGKRKVHVKDHKSKKNSTSRQMVDALAAWAEAPKARAEKYGRSVEATSTLVTPDCSITKCVAALEEIEGISDDIYMKALEKFREPDWREMFLAMSNARRSAWLFRL